MTPNAFVLEAVEIGHRSRHATNWRPSTLGQPRLRRGLYDYHGISYMEQQKWCVDGHHVYTDRHDLYLNNGARYPLASEETRPKCSRPSAAYDSPSGSGRQQELRFGVQTPARRDTHAPYAEAGQLLLEQHLPLRQNRARECIKSIS